MSDRLITPTSLSEPSAMHRMRDTFACPIKNCASSIESLGSHATISAGRISPPGGSGSGLGCNTVHLGLHQVLAEHGDLQFVLDPNDMRTGRSASKSYAPPGESGRTAGADLSDGTPESRQRERRQNDTDRLFHNDG